MPEIAEELKLTYTDILSLGETNKRIELFDGEFIQTAMPGFFHQHAATRIAVLLSEYVYKRNLGFILASPIDVVISEHTVLEPDVTFLSHERAHINDGKKYNGAPDLVIEILSESTEERDRTFKFREYARGGAKEYWLVSPEKKEIEVYKNSPNGFLLVNIFHEGEKLTSSLFPEGMFDLREIF